MSEDRPDPSSTAGKRSIGPEVPPTGRYKLSLRHASFLYAMRTACWDEAGPRWLGAGLEVEPRRCGLGGEGRRAGRDSAGIADPVLRGRGSVSARAASLLIAQGLACCRIVESDPRRLLVVLLSVACSGLTGWLA
ncbi:hypothetical protein NN561_004498 [Cricetulus griseus]